MDAPATLPADFFDKQDKIKGAVPSELPADFFDKQKEESFGKTFLQQGIGIAKGAGRTLSHLADLGGAIGSFGLAPYLESKSSGYQQAKSKFDTALTPSNRSQEIGGNIETGFEIATPILGAGSALNIGRAALGTAAGIGSGYGVYKGAEYLGAPPFIAEILGGLAAIKIGGKFSPESAAKIESALKDGGVRGWLQRLWSGTKEDEAVEFYRQQHGIPPEQVLTGKEKLTARAEAAAFKAQVKKMVQEAESGEIAKPFKPFKPNAGISRQLDLGKASGPMEQYGSAPSRIAGRTSTTAEKIKAAQEAEKEEVAEKASKKAQEGTAAPPGKRYTSTAEAKQTSSREIDLGRVGEAQAKVKDRAMATRLKSAGLTPETVAKMTETEYLQYLKQENEARKAAGLGRFDPPRPGPNRRTFAELKADIIRAMKE